MFSSDSAIVLPGWFTAGSVFTFSYSLTDATTGLPISGIASELSAQVRDEFGVLCSSLDVVESGVTAGTYLLTATDTAHWPSGLLFTDVVRTEGDARTPGPTLLIRVLEGVTR